MRMYPKLTDVLSALLVCAMAVPALAQTEVGSSRTVNDLTARASMAPAVQEINAGATLIPDRDASTSPRKLAPSVDRAAFLVPLSQDPLPSAHIRASHPRVDSSIHAGRRMPASANSVFQSAPTEFHDGRSFSQGAINLAPGTSFQRIYVHSDVMADPFGLCGTESCDEWACFVKFRNHDLNSRCGGLKSNPGHLGIPWLRSKDACDATETNIGKHKHGKHGKRRAKTKCAECGDASEGGCVGCSKNESKPGILSHWIK